MCRALFVKTVEYVVLLNEHNYDAALSLLIIKGDVVLLQISRHYSSNLTYPHAIERAKVMSRVNLLFAGSS